MTDPYFSFKEKPEEPYYSSEPFYDLFCGGYISEVDMLADKEQVEELVRARLLIETFLREAQETGHLEIT